MNNISPPTLATSDEEYLQILLDALKTQDEFEMFYKNFYLGKPDAKKFYVQILKALKEAISTRNKEKFKHFYSALGYINSLENPEELRSYYAEADNVLRSSNMVILACKYNEADIVEEIFKNSEILSNLGQNIISLEGKDETCHNAFYYAIRSGNSKLLDLLIKKWPGNHIATHLEKLDEILSSAYEELNLKNVKLTEEIKIYIENELLNLRFYSNGNEQIETDKNKLQYIKKRIKLVLDNIALLKTEYLKHEVDEKFLFIVKFIAKNIYALKRYLKSTYDKLPWEEIEFCLIAFISSYLKRQEINLFYRATLNKSKIINYLKNFAEKLSEIEGGIIIGKTDNFPKLNRDKIAENIISNCPAFEELYSDYQEIRDIYSLQKISNYVEVAVSVNTKEKEGQLVIIRTLQVIGEHLKNTLESPKMSNATIKLLLLSLPRNTRKIIIDLRNSLSHAHSLSIRRKIEENSTSTFFVGVQNDIIKVGEVISSILYGKKVNTARVLLKKIVDSKNVHDIKTVVEEINTVEILESFCNENLEKAVCAKFEMLVTALSDIITEKTREEEQLFKEINNVITSVKTKNENIDINDYCQTFILLKSISTTLKDLKMDSSIIRIIQFFSSQCLKNISPDREFRSLEKISELASKIFYSAILRMHENDIDESEEIIYKMIYFVQFQKENINWFEEMQEKLKITTSRKSAHKQISPTVMEEIRKDQCSFKLSQLNIILNNSGLSNELNEILFSYKDNKKLQAALEMLILDIMSILDHPGNNLHFLDDNVPLLIGKSLRNHLAHDNALADILSNSSIATILNAKKILNENIIENKRKIGQWVQDNPSALKTKYENELQTITNQITMFTALEEGNMEVFKTCLKMGADINARNINSWTTLHCASRGPNLEVIKYIYGQGFNTSMKDINGQNPLHIAAKFDRKKIVEFFIKELNFDVDIRDENNRTPLHIAALNGHIETAEVLLKNNANTITRDSTGLLPLHHAIRNNHLDIVKCLLAINEINLDIYKSNSGHSLLHEAAERGHFEIVDFLLKNKASVNAKTEQNWMPLHAAALNGYLKVVEALILRGADINAKVITGCTPLHYAVKNGHKDVVDILLEHGAFVNVSDRNYMYTPLHYAAKDGYQEIVETLLKNKANASALHVERMTPLHFAVENGHLKIVKILLKQNVEVNVKNIFDLTPLHFAARSGHREICEILLKNKAEVAAKDINKFTPLHAAAMDGHSDIAEILINETTLNAGDMNGQTPLHLAAMNNNKNFINILLKNEAEIDSTTDEGFTPLHMAAVNCSKEALILLLENKAGVNTKTINGLTPLHVAAEEGHEDIVKILIENKAEVNMTDTIGETILHKASRAGHKGIVELLIINGAYVDIKDHENSTPLCSAVDYNYKEIVEILIKNGADVNTDGGRPLLVAVLRGYTDIVEILLKNNAMDENYNMLHFASLYGKTKVVKALILNEDDVNVTSNEGLTLLHFAAINGDENVVQLLITRGANVNIKCNGYTPLHAAVCNDHKEIVNMLLNNGADVTIRDEKNRTSLELATSQNYLKIVQILLQNKKSCINLKGNFEWTLLHIAAQGGDLEIVKYLIEEGSDINAKNDSGSKPIHIASREGHKDIVEYFLDTGSYINDLGAANQTLLHYAAIKGQLEVVKFLIARGADVNIKDGNGSTSLHIAAGSGCKETVCALLENGAIYNFADNLKRRPLKLTKNKDIADLLVSTKKLFDAVKDNKPFDVECCIKQGAFIDAKNTDNITPLHYAAWKGYRPVVKVLLHNKANPNVIGKVGTSPLHYATTFSHLEIVKDLLIHGAVYNVKNNNGKTPMDFAEQPAIINLLQLVSDSFCCVQNGSLKVISEVNKLKEIDTIKSIMNANNRENRTLIVTAIYNNFPKTQQLKEILQDNISINLNKVQYMLNQGYYQKALDILNGLYEKRKEILGPDNPGTLDLQIEIAMALYKNGAYSEALKMLEQVYQKQKKILGINFKDTLSSGSKIALVLHRQEKNDDAFNIITEIYRKQNEILGPNHPDTLTTKLNMVLILERLGKLKEALNFSQELFKVSREMLGPLDPFTLSAQNNIAMVLSTQGKYEEAFKVYKVVYELKKTVLGSDHVDTLRIYQNMASVLCKQEKFDRALAILKSVLEIKEKKLKQYHPEILITQSLIADTLFEQGKWNCALKAYVQCREQRKSVFGQNDPIVLDISKKIEIIYLRFKYQGLDESQILEYLEKDINIAASEGDVQSVHQLLKSGIDVNDKDIDGRTSLHFAVYNGHVEIVKILLKNGVDVTQVTNKGNNVLHIAVAKGYNEIVDILLRHVNRDKLHNFINAKTLSGGTTSLHVAAKNGCLAIVKTLLRHGAVYDIKNKEQLTPLDLSQNEQVIAILKFTWDMFENAKVGNEGIVNKLRATKYDDLLAILNARNCQEYTLLQIALRNCPVNIAKELYQLLKDKREELSQSH